jgi:hypothetical protein
VSQKNRTQLKSIFAQGVIPSQQDFSDFIDSTWNISDDGSISGATGPAGAAGATGPFLVQGVMLLKPRLPSELLVLWVTQFTRFVVEIVLVVVKTT